MEFIYVVFVVILVAIVQKNIFKKHSFDRLEYSCKFDKTELMEGEEVKLVETVANKKMLPLPWMRSELTTSEHLDYAGAQSVVTNRTRYVPSFFSIKSFHRTVRSWNVKCTRRGIYNIKKCVLLTTDLLGFCDVSKTVKTDAEIMVLPKPANLTENFISAQRISGDVVVRRRYIEDPFYIAGVREYTQRDSLNRIHWPATAKSGKLMVHNNQCTAEQNLLVILNMQSTADGMDGESEQKYVEVGVKACAGFLEDTVSTGLPVRLAVNASTDGGKTPVISNEFSGSEHIHDLMRTLARIPDTYSVLFDEFLENTCRQLNASDMVIVTSFLSKKLFNFIRAKQDEGTFVKVIYTRSLGDEDIPDDIEVYSYIGEEGDLI